MRPTFPAAVGVSILALVRALPQFPTTPARLSLCPSVRLCIVILRLPAIELLSDVRHGALAVVCKCNLPLHTGSNCCATAAEIYRFLSHTLTHRAVQYMDCHLYTDAGIYIYIYSYILNYIYIDIYIVVVFCAFGIQYASAQVPGISNAMRNVQRSTSLSLVLLSTVRRSVRLCVRLACMSCVMSVMQFSCLVVLAHPCTPILACRLSLRPPPPPAPPAPPAPLMHSPYCLCLINFACCLVVDIVYAS